MSLIADSTSPDASALQALADPANFYYPRLLQAGLNQMRLDSTALRRLPPTHRAELVRDQLMHPRFGSRRFGNAGPPVRAGISGSGADLLVLTWSAAELACERAAGVRVLTAFGISAALRVANTLPGGLATPGSLLLGDVIEELGGLDVPLGSIDGDTAARQAWDLLDRVQPQVLVLEPDSATRLLAAAPLAVRPWWHTLVWVRRAPATFTPPPVPAAVGFAGTQHVWLAVPEARCFAAHTCPCGRYHFDSSLLAEISHDGTAREADSGTVVLTVLDGETALLRYVTGLHARTSRDACPCGQRGAALETL